MRLQWNFGTVIQRYDRRHISKLFMALNPLMASSNLYSRVRTEEALNVLLILDAPDVNIQPSQGSTVYKHMIS